MERHFQGQQLGKLARPGTFFDFTRYRPTVKIVSGQREMTYPNSFINYAQPRNGPDLLFLHLLEPHAMAEDYVESIVDLLKHFEAKVYCRIGAMYDSVPHTRPIVITGNPGSVETRPGAGVAVHPAAAEPVRRPHHDHEQALGRSDGHGHGHHDVHGPPAPLRPA